MKMKAWRRTTKLKAWFYLISGRTMKSKKKECLPPTAQSSAHRAWTLKARRRNWNWNRKK